MDHQTINKINIGNDTNIELHFWLCAAVRMFSKLYEKGCGFAVCIVTDDVDVLIVILHTPM